MHLVERFRRTISEWHDTVAVSHEDQRVSYGELGRLTANVSAHLLRQGLERGDRVAILVANSANYIAIYYGIWAAGGMTVALNTQAKARDIVNWTRHAGAKWLFVDASHPELDRISELTKDTIEIIRVGKHNDSDQGDEIWQGIVKSAESFPEIALEESDLASIIYTSGTTGQPKGVTLSHANLAANVDSILSYLKLNHTDSIVNVLPFYYSYGNSILHTYIAVGAKLVLENNLLYPHRVIERISNEGVTGFSGVPSTFSLILGRVKLENYDLSCLRYLTQAGGPMPPAITDRLIDTLPQVKLFIMYGQTEASARLSYLPSDKVLEKRGSIGIAIPGVTLEIRDKAGNVVAPGQTGEICAKGPNIMRGYWLDEEKTNQAIVDGWLHTGDLAHYDEDGYIYIDGRSSEMIKSGGNRISPKEVEEIIQEIEGVQEVAVVGVKDEVLGEVIKAYVVPAVGANIDMRAIQRYCKQNLAVYKIPKFVELVQVIPKTASGKVQRFALQKMHEQNGS
ncbi:MAG: class I adenylate-forming enzyme family protein [Candidatus Thiodiazotropha sp.]